MAESTVNSTNTMLAGSLSLRAKRQTEIARNCGALKSIETEYHLIQQDDIAFVVRTLSNLARKQQARKQQTEQEQKTKKRVDPFLPYEPDLFVGDISPTHICLLNKFNVVDNHLLIVTRAFEPQTDLLNLEDFAALWHCLQGIDGLAFFNGGKIAGASQPHKHMQLVPLPFLPDVVHLPIDKAIANATLQGSFSKIECFNFRHGIANLDLPIDTSAQQAAQTMLELYRVLLNKVGLKPDANRSQQPGAYNFLATRNWMAVIPRSQESWQNISINSLGFAGSLFVRDRHQLELLKKITPLKLLTEVAVN